MSRAEISETLAAFHIVRDFVCVQLVHHFLERHRQTLAVVARENPSSQSNLFQIVDAADALRFGLRLAQRGQQHRRENRHDRNDCQRRDQSAHAAPRSTDHERDKQRHQHANPDHARPDLAQNFAVEGQKVFPRIQHGVVRALRHIHAAAETGKAFRCRDVELPFRVRVRHVGLRRVELQRLRAALQRRFLLRINDVHGERLIAIRAARQRHEQPIVVALRFRGLAVDVATPEVRIRRQEEALKLFVVILHHERCLREQFARFGQHAGELRAVCHGGQHGRFLVALHVHGQIVCAASVLIREQHRARDERAVGFGEFSFVHATQRFGGGFGVQLETRCRGDGDRTRFALHIQRVNSGHGQRRALRIELIIVGDDERVTAPRLILQTNRPDIAALFLATDVRAGELNILPVGGNFHAKLLHALIDQAITDCRAAAHESIADGYEIEDFRDHAGRKPFRTQRKFPVRRVSGEG